MIVDDFADLVLAVLGALVIAKGAAYLSCYLMAHW
jgi:hypothetical protein